jgi:hypothetical protein
MSQVSGMIVIPASLRSDFIHIAGMPIHIPLESIIHIAGIRTWALSDMRDFGSPDMLRGLAQIEFTAPFYAGVGYSIASWLGCRTDLSRKIAEKVETWEENRFGHQP